MIEFRGERLTVSKNDIRTFEETLPSQLPQDFRTFLLQHNGGAPIPNTAAQANDAAPFIIHCFYAVGGIQIAGHVTPPDFGDIESAYQHMQIALGMPAFLLPIADTVDEHLILLSLRTSDFGSVYAWFSHPDPPIFETSSVFQVFPSFSNLIDSLIKTNLTQHINPVFADPPEQSQRTD